MKRSLWYNIRLNTWQRCLMIGLLVAFSSQLYLTIWADGFRISASAIVFPFLLITMMRDSHRPVAGLATGLCVVALRVLLSLYQGSTLLAALSVEYPGGVFYFCYDWLLCICIRDRRSVSFDRMWFSFFLCDFLSNLVNLLLSSHSFIINYSSEILPLMAVAALRCSVAVILLWLLHRYRALLLQEEHETRYQHLFLMTAELKTELYFLKKDSEDIEAVMSHAYQLHEQLAQHNAPQKLIDLALSIARDVHEVKKDNLRIIRGIEEEVAGAYDQETMSLSDLLHILEVTTRQFLGEQRADIRLECRCREDFLIREHYRLLSVLKNLVTNAAEAIQSAGGYGLVAVDCQKNQDNLVLRVTDNGPGIPPRSMKLLFEVGYSTKFNPETGDINRGVGLPAVRYIVDELDGDIQVSSTPGNGTCFQLTFPLITIAGGPL